MQVKIQTDEPLTLTDDSAAAGSVVDNRVETMTVP